MTDIDILNSEYLPNETGAQITYPRWRTSYTQEVKLFDSYLIAVQAGHTPSPPTLTSKKGRALVAAVQMAAAASAPTPPPPSGDVYSKPFPLHGCSPGYTIINRSAAMQDWELDHIRDVFGAGALVRLDYPDPTRADAVIAKTLARDLEPLIVVAGTMHAGSLGTPWSVPVFKQRCIDVATKYHGKVRFFEPMNEPNSNGWTGIAYEPYQWAMHDAVKAVDQRNISLFAGLNPDTLGTESVTFVSDFYKAGGKGSYEIGNGHFYADASIQANWVDWCKVFGCGVVSPSVRDIMAANGDGAKPVVGTECGRRGVPEDQQAAGIVRALTDPRILFALVYDMLDTVPGYGLMVQDSAGTVVAPDGTKWRQRPAYFAAKAVTPA